jgi:hypothetical protein
VKGIEHYFLDFWACFVINIASSFYICICTFDMYIVYLFTKIIEYLILLSPSHDGEIWTLLFNLQDYWCVWMWSGRNMNRICWWLMLHIHIQIYIESCLEFRVSSVVTDNRLLALALSLAYLSSLLLDKCLLFIRRQCYLRSEVELMHNLWMLGEGKFMPW